MKNFRSQYTPKTSIRLKNNVTNEITLGDIVNEEEIEGRQFYVVRVGPRLLKLSKEGFTLMKTSRKP